MDRNSNGYTFLFAGIMVVVVGALLAFAATSLKPMQDVNIKNEKMQNILSTIGVTDVTREEAQGKFDEFIKEQLALKVDGSTDEAVNAFTIDLKAELKKSPEEQRFPIYVAEKDGNKFYIIPLRGAGLWDAIWGYIALNDDFNTIAGVSFDHKGETPGLGANITESFFKDDFKGEMLFDASGNYKSGEISKSNGDPNNEDKTDNQVDAISGATITGNGVGAMLKSGIKLYLPYFETLKK